MSIVSLETKDEKNISRLIAQFWAVYGIISLVNMVRIGNTLRFKQYAYCFDKMSDNR